MKIFVTGATGFIGKYLVKQLTDEGNEITVNIRGEKLSPFDNNVKTYQLGVNDIATDILFLSENKFDGIIHLASLYLTIHKPEDAVKLIDSNVGFSTYVLECASQANIKWFINTGTFWQNYENAEYSPVNLYAASKQAFEAIAQFYYETKRIHFNTLKLCDTYGPNDTRPKIFNLWSRIAKSGEMLDMSPGNQIIDIAHIEDIVCAYILLANHINNKDKRINNGDTFAVKTANRYTLKELSVIFEEATSQKLNIVWGGKPYREREVMIPWEDGNVVPDWTPFVSIFDGIKGLNL